jgi:predicted enzyme related to lactoylglutathione lyase
VPEGKICYVEIPAKDAAVSAKFYAKVFGWKIRERGDGAKAFDDSTAAVSGSWVEGRTARSDPGMLTYVMVDSIEVTMERVISAGGNVVTRRTPIGTGGEAYATFLDPAANLIGLYEERKG